MSNLTHFNTLKFLGANNTIMVRGNKLFFLAYEASLAIESWLIQECHSADKICNLFPFNTFSSLDTRQKAQTISRVFTIAVIKLGIEQRIHKSNAKFEADMVSQSKFSTIQEFSLQILNYINDYPKESVKKIEAIFINIIREINHISPEQAKKLLPSQSLNIDFLMRLIKATQEQATKTQGVVYTPDYVCQFIFSGLNYLLKHFFTKSRGLLDQDLLFYDPAVGPLTFEVNLWSFLAQLHTRDSQKEKLDFNTIFKRFWGNEIDLVAIIIGLLEKMHIFPVSNPEHENFPLISNIFVSSALTPDFSEFLSQNSAYRHHCLVIFGNPPYSVSSPNKDPWIYRLMKEYAVDEPNITRIYDDYIKFIRYAQYLLEAHGQGVLGYITNRKFLDGKIFYGMRHRLCKVFSAIYIVDLLGDSRNIKHSNESIENIFGIQTGIAIVFFVKRKSDIASNSEMRELCPVYYAKITGTSAEVQKLLQNGFEAQKFEQLSLLPPKYLLLPREAPESIAEFWESKCWPITSVFKVTSRAMISSRDNFMIHVDRAPLLTNLDLLEKGDFKALRLQGRIRKGVDPLLENPQIVATFNIQQMRESIIPINYRAFDLRHAIFYTINRRCGKSIILDHLNHFEDFWIPCRDVTNKTDCEKDSHLKNSEGLAINFVQSVQKSPFSHVFITQGVVDSGLFGYSTSKVAPLFIDGAPNISIKFIEQIQQWKSDISPSEIFGYIYGSFFSNVYSAVFEHFLLHEFPRVIFPPNLNFFNRIASYGSHLMQLHRYKLQTDETQRAIDRFSKAMGQKFEPGSLVLYEYSTDTLILHMDTGNRSADNTLLTLKCPLSVYRYKIGSISVISHWLDARLRTELERDFSIDDLWQLILTIAILDETLVIRKKIDAEYFTYLPILASSAHASEFYS